MDNAASSPPMVESAGASRPSGQASASSPPFVCFAAVDWWYHNRAHSELQLMQRVAKTRPVLLVNSIGMRMPLPGRSTQPWRRIARKARSFTRGLQHPVPELPDFAVLSPVVLPVYGKAWGRALNARLVRAQVKWAMRRLHFDDPIYVVTIPTAWDAVRPLPRRALLVNRSDKHSAFGETDQAMVAELEHALVQAGDRVLYTSHALMEEEAPDAGARAVFIDHGVDLAHFAASRSEPADLERIPRPRIGFFGGLDDYIIDFALLERVARDIPEAQLVLIGDATCPLGALESMANVHWLGFKAYEDIPAYGAGFQVALMPLLDSEWIRASNPVKLKEYLALGLPVVSTDFPEVHRYAAWIDVAPTADDFVRLVRKRLAEPGDAAARRAVVAGDSWDERAAQLIEVADAVSTR